MAHQILYKFAGPGGASIIESNRLLITSPDRFNDIFECVPAFESPTLRDYQLEGDPVFNANDTLDSILAQVHDEKVHPDIQKYLLEEIAPRLRVLCLCRNNKSPLMWAHYAQSHEGIAIGFDSKMISEATGDTAMKVRYPRERPLMKITKVPKSGAFLRSLLGTKSFHWKYEQEYRFVVEGEQWGFGVLNGRPAEFVSFPPEAVREIIFGLRCDNILQQRILHLCAGRYSRVCFFQAVRHPKRFELHIEPQVWRPGVWPDAPG